MMQKYKFTAIFAMNDRQQYMTVECTRWETDIDRNLIRLFDLDLFVAQIDLRFVDICYFTEVK